jgi:uncharacterized Zn-binding protein involved in type VI secretion
MSKPAAAFGDIAAHGGTVVIGSMNVLIGGRPAARKGDPVACALHGMGTVTQGSSTVFINGMPAARLGDMTGCMIPGLAAISVPAVLGPPSVPASLEAPPIQGARTLAHGKDGKFHEENDKAKGGPRPYTWKDASPMPTRMEYTTQ